MNYSKKTLISDWHKNREAEPKDYDISAGRDGQRKLHKSTYRHLGTYLDADWRTTTQTAHSNKEHEPKNTAKSMVQADYFHSLVFERQTRTSDTAVKSVLSSYLPRCNENELITTYALNYVPPRITTKQTFAVFIHDQAEKNKATMQAKELVDRKLDFRRHQSQFTDVADHRRWGRNTWQDFSDERSGKLPV